MLRLVPAALLAATLVATLAGCSGDADSPGSTAAPTPTRTPIPTPYDEYVALGDSYTAAPLVPPTDISSICLRSEVNYPALVSEALEGIELTDVSCSGADTTNTVDDQTGRGGDTVPPQFDALADSTDLVTIGLGGNDENLFATLLGKCTELAATEPDGTPCETAVAENGEVQPVLDQIGDNVAAVVEGVRGRSPQARILVIGYPQIVPADGTCDLLPLATGDYPFARSVNEGLADAVRRGADEADAEFIDLWAPSADHDICADDPWINGRVTSASTALAYHPFAVEQRAVADLVIDLVTR